MNYSKRQTDLASFFKKWEGGLSRDPKDTASVDPCPTPYKGKTGYHTNKGITYQTWKSFFGKSNDKRFHDMSDADWFQVFEKGYWNPMAKVTDNELILCVLSSWAWGSGVNGAIKHLQRFLRVEDDGIVGKNTRGALSKVLSNHHEKYLALLMCDNRAYQFSKMKSFDAHGKGWLNRLKEFREFVSR